MPDLNIDLTGVYSNQENGGTQENTQGAGDNSQQQPDNNQQQNGQQNGNENSQGTDKGGGTSQSNGNGTSEGNGSSQQQQEESTDLNPGDTIELGNEKYTVDGNGDLIDSKGQVFKAKAEIADWLKDFDRAGDKGKEEGKQDTSDNKQSEQQQEGELTIDKVKDLVGIDIVDDNDQPVEFTNDEAGIKSYLSAVSEKQVAEAANGAVNKFLEQNPQVQDFVNYLIVNNGNPYGYGQIVDSSQIHIDKDDPQQQEAIVRHAAKVLNNPMVNDNYIKYLKDTGTLLQEAKSSLDTLVKNEQAYKQQLQQQAEAQQKAQAQQVEAYWNNVGQVISSGVIGDFKLPEAFTKEVNGRKMTYNRSDFFDYLSRASVKDDNGNAYTQYQADLANLSDEDVLNRELLDAWLMFTGGSIKDLVNILTKENEVKNIKLQAREANAHKTIILNQKQGNYKAEDIAFS